MNAKVRKSSHTPQQFIVVVHAKFDFFVYSTPQLPQMMHVSAYDCPEAGSDERKQGQTALLAS